MDSRTHNYPYNLGLAFESVARVFPGRTAIKFVDGSSITYAELDSRANRCAQLLIETGVQRRDVVCILQNKSVEGFAAMLACLKVGAIYTNLDDQNPVERLQKILENCRPRLAVCDSAPSASALEAMTRRQVRHIVLIAGSLSEAGSVQSSPPYIERMHAVNGEDPAYLMFTSGSTGVPKGAVISHGGVLNLIAWSRSHFGITVDDVLTNLNPVYFDNSVFDFYSALFTGACLAAGPREMMKMPREIVEFVSRQGCTLWFSVPSLLIYLMTVKALSPASLPAMKTIAFGGEGYPKPELKKLFDYYGSRMRLVNVYGPTECTCICSAYDIGAADFNDMAGLPPLGNLCPNFDYVILDADDRPCTHGETGELCLMGPNVGLGYYNDPARTEAAFCHNPANTSYPQRMYRCGDLVRVNAISGYLEFVGRKDNQIKHQGYRIELEEIEAGLHTLPYVIQAGAIYKRTRAEYGEIIAFIASHGAPNEMNIREDLKNILPDYMIPRRLIVLSDLPKNANGKVDRPALHAMV